MRLPVTVFLVLALAGPVLSQESGETLLERACQLPDSRAYEVLRDSRELLDQPFFKRLGERFGAAMNGDKETARRLAILGDEARELVGQRLRYQRQWALHFYPSGSFKIWKTRSDQQPPGKLRLVSTLQARRDYLEIRTKEADWMAAPLFRQMAALSGEMGDLQAKQHQIAVAERLSGTRRELTPASEVPPFSSQIIEPLRQKAQFDSAIAFLEAGKFVQARFLFEQIRRGDGYLAPDSRDFCQLIGMLEGEWTEDDQALQSALNPWRDQAIVYPDISSEPTYPEPERPSLAPDGNVQVYRVWPPVLIVNTKAVATSRKGRADEYCNKGQARLKAGNEDQAVGFFLEAIHSNPDSTRAALPLVHWLFGKGRFEAGILYANLAVKSHPENSQAWHWLGRCHEALFEQDHAFSDLARASQAESLAADLSPADGQLEIAADRLQFKRERAFQAALSGP